MQELLFMEGKSMKVEISIYKGICLSNLKAILISWLRDMKGLFISICSSR